MFWTTRRFQTFAQQIEHNLDDDDDEEPGFGAPFIGVKGEFSMEIPQRGWLVV